MTYVWMAVAALAGFILGRMSSPSSRGYRDAHREGYDRGLAAGRESDGYPWCGPMPGPQPPPQSRRLLVIRGYADRQNGGVK